MADDLWRHRFPPNIQSKLVTFQNPGGTINNSDLELAGSLLQQEAVAKCYDVRERTTKDSTDNDVLRPLDASDDSTRREPISISKLQQGDASRNTFKKVLGWIVDSVAMTLTLPLRRLALLEEILASIPSTQKRLALEKWYKLLGELRSMSIALPASRGLFSSLQAVLRTRNGTRLTNAF